MDEQTNGEASRRSATNRTEFEQTIGREYLREFGLAMLAYVVALPILIGLVDVETAGDWKYAAILIPVIPVLFGIRAFVRHLNRMDEMQRHLQHEALSVGFAAAIVTAVSLGFLNIAGLDLDGAEMWIVFVVAMLTWGVSAGIRTLRLTNGPG